jgi:hypothetical protein
MRCLFHSIEIGVILWHFRGVWPNIIRMHPQLVRPCSSGLIRRSLWDVLETFPTYVATLMPSPDREKLSNRETSSSAEWTSIALIHWSTFWNFPETRWPYRQPVWWTRRKKS